MFRHNYLYLIASCSILTLMMQASVFGEVRNVYESDGATGIQDSINISGAGDTVLVHDGIYYVRDALGITMRDSIVFMSVNGAESCTLSGLDSMGINSCQVIRCGFSNPNSHAAIIEGFTITGGDAYDYDHPTWAGGGGIFCWGASPVIKSCKIVGNIGGLGGGIFLDGSSSILIDNIIMNNYAYQGGGLSVNLSFTTKRNNSLLEDSIVIARNIIANNFASEGGGVCFGRWMASPVSFTNNIIIDNYAYVGGGLSFWQGGTQSINNCLLARNIGEKGGAIYVDWNATGGDIQNCFILDNGSIESIKSGLLYTEDSSYEIYIHNSHLYYNTFQPDIEIDNNTGIIPLENNFWWDTTEAGINSLIEGPADFMPFEYDFIPGVPGEPTSIDSVRNYDSDYSVVIDSLWDNPDTLYLRIYGEDRNTRFREAAVAIIRSSVYPTGIAVAIIETDTSSGIYEGKAIVKTSTGNDTIRIDDIYQTVRVDSLCDSLQIVANMDTAQKFVVYYRICPGVEESESRSGDLSHTRLFQNYPNPFTRKTVIHVRFSCSDQHKLPARITIYDLSGRLVRILPIPQSPNNPITSVSWDGKDKDGKMLGSGVYFYKLEAGDFTKTRKMFLIK